MSHPAPLSGGAPAQAHRTSIPTGRTGCSIPSWERGPPLSPPIGQGGWGSGTDINAEYVEIASEEAGTRPPPALSGGEEIPNVLVPQRGLRQGANRR